MRIFIVAMQSSGASLFAYWLGQMDDYLCVIDLFVRAPIPSKELIPQKNIVMKATISAPERQPGMELFQPDRTILFLRDPYQTYASLSTKSYRDLGGTLEEKFKMLDSVCEHRDSFDIVVTYEDFLSKKAATVEMLHRAGIPAELQNYEFNKPVSEIVDHTRKNSRALRSMYGRDWGAGNIVTENGTLIIRDRNRKTQSDVIERVNQLCPTLVEYYRQLKLSQSAGEADGRV